MARVPFTTTEKKVVKARTKGRCAKCLMNAMDQIHHITPVVDGGTNDPENLIGLCSACHAEWHSFTSGYIAFADWLEYPPAVLLVKTLILYGNRPDGTGELTVSEFLATVKQAMQFEAQSR